MGVLEGKVAVITGSSRGLGLAIAQAYVREGAAVVLAGRSSAALAEAAAACERQGARVSWQVTEVGDLEQVKALADHTVKLFGKIDIWVNNAGYAGVYGPTAAIDPQDFERVVRTNILGEYYGSWVALQHFLAQGRGGKLINLLGRGESGPVALQNAYASSKAWVRNFTLALAKEYKQTDIGIYAFQPGLVETDLLRKVEVVQGYERKLRIFSTIIRLWANAPLSRQKRRSGWHQRQPMARPACTSVSSRLARRSLACCANCTDWCSANLLAIHPSRSRLLHLYQRSLALPIFSRFIKKR